MGWKGSHWRLLGKSIACAFVSPMFICACACVHVCLSCVQNVWRCISLTSAWRTTWKEAKMNARKTRGDYRKSGANEGLAGAAAEETVRSFQNGD